MNMKILTVVGARPNFIKVAPFINAIGQHNKRVPEDQIIIHTLVHTGQHYDDRMSQSFFKSLGIPEADINLGIGSGTHAQQVGLAMIELEKVMRQIKPDWVVVVGDVNATLAASVTAKKEWVKVCHIEAGLRSGDLKMPEEVNRMVTDRLSDLLLTPDRLSGENLLTEGIPEHKIVFAGNIMIDTLEANRDIAAGIKIPDIILANLFEDSSHAKGHKVQRLNIGHLIAAFRTPETKYALCTLHRPSNVDSREILTPIINFLCNEVTADMPLLWPIHPRTRQRLIEFGLWKTVLSSQNMVLMHPLGYHDMLRLNMGASVMLTDSGGLQEECTVLGTPCLTLRFTTERPVTLKEHGGAGILVGNDVNKMRVEYYNALKNKIKPVRPELWDGKTAERCLTAILEHNAMQW